MKNFFNKIKLFTKLHKVWSTIIAIVIIIIIYFAYTNIFTTASTVQYTFGRVKKGDLVGVIGLGGLGHMAVQLAAAMGADVFVISRSNKKKEDSKRI
jgi:NADPH:quinone reductase-like Zn-dependent oxidoreductase